jgi:hypothetical protein
MWGDSREGKLRDFKLKANRGKVKGWKGGKAEERQRKGRGKTEERQRKAEEGKEETEKGNK